MKTKVSQVLISNIKSFRNLAMFLNEQYPKLSLKQTERTKAQNANNAYKKLLNWTK